MASRRNNLFDQAATQATGIAQLPGGGLRAGWISIKPCPTSSRFRILEEYHLLYLVHGSGQLTDAQGQTTSLIPGSRVDRHPQLPHTITRLRGGHWLEFYITLSPSLHRAMCDLGLLHPQRIHSHAQLTTSLLKACLQFNEYLHSHIPGSGTVNQLVHLLGRFEDAAQHSDHASEQTDQLQHAAHLLSDMRQQHTSLPRIAEQIGMTYETFRKHFAQQFGKSPQRYRIEHRINQARHQLLETEISIESLAQSLGYNDVFCFSRQFKTLCNMSPTHYRRRSNR